MAPRVGQRSRPGQARATHRDRDGRPAISTCCLVVLSVLSAAVGLLVAAPGPAAGGVDPRAAHLWAPRSAPPGCCSTSPAACYPPLSSSSPSPAGSCGNDAGSPSRHRRAGGARGVGVGRQADRLVVRHLSDRYDGAEGRAGPSSALFTSTPSPFGLPNLREEPEVSTELLAASSLLSTLKPRPGPAPGRKDKTRSQRGS